MNELERRRWEHLLLWLRDEHGMDVSEDGLHVEARDVEGAGRGMFALRDCPRGDTLFKIPSTALMNRTTVAKLYPQLREWKLSATQLISLHLMLHKPSGEDDSSDLAFGPYISTLPRDFSSHPLTWMVKQKLEQESDWERRSLALLPPGSARKLTELHKRFWKDWEALAPILPSRPDLSSSSIRIEDNTALVLDYVWAWLNVNTRCIFYRIRANRADPDNLTLCPVLDFANHSNCRTHIFPVIDSEVWGVVTKKPSKYFVFFGPSQDPIVKGQELYLQYGDHSNSFLFSEYGFVNGFSEGAHKSGAYSGQVDVQELVEGLFVEKGSLGTRMKSTLEDEGYWGDWTLHSAPTPAHPSYRLTTALRLFHVFDKIDTGDGRGVAFEAGVETWRNVVNGHADNISPENEDEWRQTLLRICERIMDRARSQLRAMASAVDDRDDDVTGWQKWMTGSVLVLWKEEHDVAEAVMQSIVSGVEF
ncbi:SET domain-containing protein [Ganoderma leucocontextum]|nr:SET domain-containing protein [Ganoderma leucocontextum]